MKYRSQLLGATVCPEEQTILFYGGIFSQWAPGHFFSTHLQEDVNCAEQAMMMAKAKFFNDMRVYDMIKNEKRPREQKALGRLVSNFDYDAWTKKNIEIVTSISFDKFSQIGTYKELLILTDPYTLVEASPIDKIWGIGFDEHYPDIFKCRKTWGENRLGQSIMAAREKIINQ